MASPDAGAAVTAAIFAYPKDAAERRTRVWYGLVFILSKSCALALTFIPPSNDSAQQLFALSIANLVFSFLLDACAKRESKRWAGEEGDGTHFYYCFLETILGSWITARFVGAIKNGWNRRWPPWTTRGCCKMADITSLDRPDYHDARRQHPPCGNFRRVSGFYRE